MNLITKSNGSPIDIDNNYPGHIQKLINEDSDEVMKLVPWEERHYYLSPSALAGIIYITMM